VNASAFTPVQRFVILSLGLAVIVVFAMVAGFAVTYRQMAESPVSALTPTLAPLPPTPLPATPLPTPSPSPAPPVEIWSPVQAARLLDQVERQVETLRALSPRAEVPLNFLDEQEMTDLLHQLFDERDPEAELLPYTALGMLPGASISIHAHQVAGVYVPEQEQLYVGIGGQGSSADDQALLAHAYAHALQDQHFDLGVMDARATTTDAALAVQALVEGDATLLAALYRYEGLLAADWLHLGELILQAERPSYGEVLDNSEAWARLQRFPYQEGRQFADALFVVGGWDAVNQAYIAPPRSTEQVLHPERYLAEEQDIPTGVGVPDLGAILGEDWTLLLQDTLGEFVVGLYLDEALSEEMAWQAADGWDGDTFVVWEREDGARVRVWRTVWDTTTEAAEFERALVALVPQRYLPVWPVEPPGGMAGQWWETGSGAVHVSRVARYVIFVYAPDINALTNVVGVLP